jgi:signal transduction histidine kinase
MPQSSRTQREANLGDGTHMSERELGDLLLRACHDLRSPARAVRTHTERIRKGSPSPELENDFMFVADGVRQIDLLTDRLSSYAIALQTEPSSFGPVRVDVLLRTLLARLDGELRSCGAEVICGELPCVSGNSDRLFQVFEELVRNALRHCGCGSPRIGITAVRHQDEWLFTVRDNGRGIETDYLERVFRPFERLNSAYREGAGMGLTICRIIVERHGGRLWAESTRSGGAVLLLTLPFFSETY